MTRILVTSASGANGDGYGAILSFDAEGRALGPFSTDRRIADPSGLASGVGPSGEGDNTILGFDRDGTLRAPRLVTDPDLSPLDLVVAPNGNIVVASESPFGAPDAATSVREYDPSTGSSSGS